VTEFEIETETTMKYAVTANVAGCETIIRVLPLKVVPLWNPDSPAPGTCPVPDEVEEGWVRDGDGWVPPPFSIDKIIASYTAAVQSRLDAFAKTKGYDGIFALCTYAASENAQFRQEGQRGVSLRDATWVKFYEVMEQVKSDQRELPTPDELLAELPELIWD